MQSDILVSVIIPVYNTAEYLERTVKCLHMQTYTIWEAIFIDDGSSDNSGMLLDDFAKIDSRIQVIHKKNEGVSIARNIGISNAVGDKILFLDSDDIFEPCLIEDCLNCIEQFGSESVLYGYANWVEGVINDVHKFELEKKLFSGADEIIEILIPHFIGISYEDINGWIRKKRNMRQGKEHTALWRIMCDAACIKNHKINFNPELSLGEDTMFMNSYLYYSQSIAVLDKTLYYLVSRTGSANYINNHNIRLMISNKLKLIREKEKFAEFVRQEKGYDITKYFLGNHILSALQICIGLANDLEVAKRHGLTLYKQFCKLSTINGAITHFTPKWGVRCIPFYFLKYAKTLLYIGCCLIPSKLLNKFYI